MTKYSAQNVLLGTTVLSSVALPADFSKRGIPIFAFSPSALGNLQTARDVDGSFPLSKKNSMQADYCRRRIITPKPVIGRDSGGAAGEPSIKFAIRPEEEIPELFAHVDCSHALRLGHGIERTGPPGVRVRSPIVCADIPEFREMAGMRGCCPFFTTSADANGLAEALVTILPVSRLQRQMRSVLRAGVQMTMASVVTIISVV